MPRRGQSENSIKDWLVDEESCSPGLCDPRRMSGFPCHPWYLELAFLAEPCRIVVVSEVNIAGQSTVFQKLPELLAVRLGVVGPRS